MKSRDIEIGARIRKTRQYRKMTQQNLADKMEVSQTAIALWEKGSRSIPLEAIEEMAEHLCVSAGYLLFGTKDTMDDIPENSNNNNLVIDTEIDKNHPFNIIQKKINNGEKLTQEEIHLYNRHLKQSTDATMQSLKKFGDILRSAYSEYYELLNEKGKIEADKIIDKATKQAQEQSEEQVKLLTKIPEYRKDASSDHKTPKADQENFKTDPKE